MRGVSLLLAAEDNPLVKKFCNNVYPYLPEELQRYYNAFFAMKSPDLTKEATEEVCKNVLYCQEYATQPDFNADSTMEVIDKVLPDIIRAIEYGQTHSICWHINKSVLKLIRLKGYKYKRLRIRRIRGIGYYAGFAWKKETVSLIENNRLPKNYYGLETLRAYCEYLKAEALKQPLEKPVENYPSSFYPFIKEGLLVSNEEGLVSTCPSVRDLIFRMTETGHKLPKTKDIHTCIVQARICTEDSIRQYRKDANSHTVSRIVNKK